jgi:hypothetical protein
MVNPTYKHLGAKVRLRGLTLGQWAQLSAASVAAVVFGVYLSPLPIGPTIWVSVFVAGLPVVLSYGAMGLDFSVTEFALAVWRWWRSPRLFVPADCEPTGYRIECEEQVRATAGRDAAPRMEALWD